MVSRSHFLFIVPAPPRSQAALGLVWVPGGSRGHPGARVDARELAWTPGGSRGQRGWKPRTGLGTASASHVYFTYFGNLMFFIVTKYCLFWDF